MCVGVLNVLVCTLKLNYLIRPPQWSPISDINKLTLQKCTRKFVNKLNALWYFGAPFWNLVCKVSTKMQIYICWDCWYNRTTFVQINRSNIWGLSAFEWNRVGNITVPFRKLPRFNPWTDFSFVDVNNQHAHCYMTAFTKSTDC